MKTYSIEEILEMQKAEWTEEIFTAKVLLMAKEYGWKTAHFRPAKTAKGWRTAVQGQGKGFPDLILCRGKWQIAAELKVKKNKPSLEQLAWLEAFRMTGAATFIWYPSQFDEICDLLESAK
jgi:hypothetical protein